jgi:DNA-binding transcriptional ArsR family regulator
MAVRRKPVETEKDRAAKRIVDVFDSDFFRALAEPARVELLKVLLLQGSLDIHSIAQHLPQDRSVLSRHLQTLLRAGVVDCVKEGRRRIYSLRGGPFIDRLEGILSSVKELVAICCPQDLR